MSWLLDATSAFDKLRRGNSDQTGASSLYDIRVPLIEGGVLDWEPLSQKFLLIVNVASRCGFTPQYRELERVYRENRDRLEVIGVPCNQFGAQEPGTESEIAEFCSTEFQVTFPMTAKLLVKGADQHPLYAWLGTRKLNGVRSSTVRWNFHKYLVGPGGQWLGSYLPTTAPSSPSILRRLTQPHT